MSPDQRQLIDEIHELLTKQSRILEGEIDAEAALQYSFVHKRIRDLFTQHISDEHPKTSAK